jgi:hypothetical protein
MRSRLSFPKCDSAWSVGRCDRLYLSKGAIAFLSRDAIASIFPKVRSRFRIMYAIASIFTQSASAYSVSVDAIAHPKQMGSVYSTHQIVNPDICTKTYR